MQPSLLKRLEGLFQEVMDSAELRRFVTNLYGKRVTSQLPGEGITHELLSHGVVTVLSRNGLIDREFFVELIGERPRMRPHIVDLAAEFGVPALAVDGTDALPQRVVRSPDYVVRDSYESLRRQRQLVRELTHGELHLARLIGQAVRQDEAQLREVPGRVVAWIDAHRHELTLRELQGPIEGIYIAFSVFTVSPEVAVLGSLAVLGFTRGEALQQLLSFVTLSDNDLYALALTLAESGR
ncbi:hypothetical protein [Nannocystis bainbridge]|uniref:Uncharacterized protein n=1 Tax=Nannocystis bainbridge TaxID=2995303 RepID=A0ABT5E6N8_9BACT|nr:hypothetical protein [Nannocystis bainbridge]MDC0721529.1 hypothetical protein [Nannocystis bainbridge]